MIQSDTARGSRSVDVAILDLTTTSIISLWRLLFRSDAVLITYSLATLSAKIVIAGLCRIKPSLSFERLPSSPVALPARLLLSRERQNLRSEVHRSITRVLERVSESGTFETTSALGRSFPEHQHDSLRMLLKTELATEIQPYMFLAYYCVSRTIHDSNRPGVLVVPNRWWTTQFRRELAHHPLRVQVVPWGLTQVGRYVRRAVEKMRRAIAPPKSEFEPRWYLPRFIGLDHGQSAAPRLSGGGRVGSLVLDSLDPRQRSNAEWFWEDDFPKDRAVFVIWDHITNRQVAPDAIRVAQEAGATILRQSARTKPIYPDVPRFRASVYRRCVYVFRGLMRMGLLVARSLGEGRVVIWQVFHLGRALVHSSWWYDLFTTSGISIFVEEYQGFDANCHSIAAREAGCTVVLAQRSLEYDHYQFFAERSSDVFLFSGVHDLQQTVDLRSKQRVVYTGLAGHRAALRFLGPSREEERERLGGSRPIVTFVDEPGFIYGSECIHEFYKLLLSDLASRPSYVLLVKSKKKQTVSEVAAEISGTIQELETRGSLIFCEPSCPVSVPFGLSDAVICVPSTAMFEAMHAGVRVAVYNPYRTLHKLFYEDELKDQVVFDDPVLMLASLREYLEGKDSSFGRGDRFVPKIDPFGDQLSAGRIAGFLASLSEKPATAETAEERLSRSLDVYGRRNGAEMVGSGSELIARWSAAGVSAA